MRKARALLIAPLSSSSVAICLVDIPLPISTTTLTPRPGPMPKYSAVPTITTVDIATALITIDKIQIVVLSQNGIRFFADFSCFPPRVLISVAASAVSDVAVSSMIGLISKFSLIKTLLNIFHCFAKLFCLVFVFKIT